MSSQREEERNEEEEPPTATDSGDDVATHRMWQFRFNQTSRTDKDDHKRSIAIGKATTSQWKEICRWLRALWFLKRKEWMHLYWTTPDFDVVKRIMVAWLRYYKLTTATGALETIQGPPPPEFLQVPNSVWYAADEFVGERKQCRLSWDENTIVHLGTFLPEDGDEILKKAKTLKDANKEQWSYWIYNGQAHRVHQALEQEGLRPTVEALYKLHLERKAAGVVVPRRSQQELEQDAANRRNNPRPKKKPKTKTKTAKTPARTTNTAGSSIQTPYINPEPFPNLAAVGLTTPGLEAAWQPLLDLGSSASGSGITVQETKINRDVDNSPFIKQSTNTAGAGVPVRANWQQLLETDNLKLRDQELAAKESERNGTDEHRTSQPQPNQQNALPVDSGRKAPSQSSQPSDSENVSFQQQFQGYQHQNQPTNPPQVPYFGNDYATLYACTSKQQPLRQTLGFPQGCRLQPYHTTAGEGIVTSSHCQEACNEIPPLKKVREFATQTMDTPREKAQNQATQTASKNILEQGTPTAPMKAQEQAAQTEPKKARDQVTQTDRKKAQDQATQASPKEGRNQATQTEPKKVHDQATQTEQPKQALFLWSVYQNKTSEIKVVLLSPDTITLEDVREHILANRNSGSNSCGVPPRFVFAYLNAGKPEQIPFSLEGMCVAKFFAHKRLTLVAESSLTTKVEAAVQTTLPEKAHRRPPLARVTLNAATPSGKAPAVSSSPTMSPAMYI